MDSVSESDEYREKWQYIRHAEQIRYRSIQWYVGIVGVLLGFIYGEPTGPLPNQIRPLVLTFLVGYSLFLTISLVARKAIYQIYADRVAQLEPKKGSVLFHPWRGPFSLYFYGFLLLGLFLAFLWGWEALGGANGSPISSSEAWLSALGFAVLAGGYFVLLMVRLRRYLESRFPERYSSME